MRNAIIVILTSSVLSGCGLGDDIPLWPILEDGFDQRLTEQVACQNLDMYAYSTDETIRMSVEFNSLLLPAWDNGQTQQAEFDFAYVSPGDGIYLALGEDLMGATCKPVVERVPDTQNVYEAIAGTATVTAEPDLSAESPAGTVSVVLDDVVIHRKRYLDDDSEHDNRDYDLAHFEYAPQYTIWHLDP